MDLFVFEFDENISNTFFFLGAFCELRTSFGRSSGVCHRHTAWELSCTANNKRKNWTICHRIVAFWIKFILTAEDGMFRA